MFGLPPLTPKQATNNVMGDKITSAINNYESGDNVAAMGDLAHVVAVAAAYAAGTLAGFGSQYAISGLDSAIRALSKDPSGIGANLIKMGLINDPLVAQRITNVGKAFAGGAAAGYIADRAINLGKSINIGSKIYDLLHPDDPLRPPSIDPKCSNDFTAAKNWAPPRDPLILDLDGIQTRAIDPAAPILFDHNADGIKTGTGWVGAGEGMVVLDLDGNGSIDSGRELFGDNTVITSGARAGQFAANGFEAIAQYDADADGAIDSSDAIYSQLRIWQDSNADGISQSAELKTLAELGIASIGVAGQTDGSSLGGGNTQAQKGSFTRTDGSTGNSASVQLAADNFYREFTDDPALAQAAAALPQMGGSGAVRDLREAMSLGTAQAAALQAKLAEFAAGKAHFIASIF